jgi:PIN domain nuclease of toxin-antitoxin system
VNNEDYTNQIKRNDALIALATNYEMSIKEVKNKIKSLRSYFAKEHQKVVRVWTMCTTLLGLRTNP